MRAFNITFSMYSAYEQIPVSGEFSRYFTSRKTGNQPVNTDVGSKDLIRQHCTSVDGVGVTHVASAGIIIFETFKTQPYAPSLRQFGEPDP